MNLGASWIPDPRFRPLPLAFLLIAAAVASAPLRAAPPEAAPPETERPGEARADQAVADSQSLTIVTLGDSITKGVRGGVTAEQTFASLIEGALREVDESARVVNVGIGGERTDQALRRLDQVVALEPDIVTIMYGTNDSYVDQGKTASRLSLEEYRGNLERLVAELLRRGIRPVLMTEPRWADDARTNGLDENPNIRLEPYVVACRETAAKWRVPLVDHFAHWTAARAEGQRLREWTTDGCHPNPAGHSQLASAITPVIQRMLQPERPMRRKLEEKDRWRIVCFGDSVTGVYYHTGSRRAYTDMLGVALRQVAPGKEVEMINAGISGHTTVNGLERLERDVLSRRPDVVTVMFGLNDMTRVPLETYRENLMEIVERCRAAGAEVILATPNNVISTDARPTEKLIAYCDVVRQVGRETSVPVCDVYRRWEAVRHLEPFQWRLWMSDPIHPNMDGHKRIAAALAQTLTGRRATLDDVAAPPPALPHTRRKLRDGQPVRILAMPPFDEHIRSVLKRRYPDAELEVRRWSVDGQSLEEIEQAARRQVRPATPDLVVLAVPRSPFTAEDLTDQDFVHHFGWIMNWSLNFGPPTWDCLVIHPAVWEPSDEKSPRDELIRVLVRAQDLPLVERIDGQSGAAAILDAWWERREAD